MKKLLVFWLVVLCIALGLTSPFGLSPDAVPDHVADASAGERLFHAGGCASCHGEIVDAKPVQGVMAGGLEMHTTVGTFLVPNISSDPDHGIGAWSELDFLNAMQRGVSPDGRHYYPAFPYTSYARMTRTDLLDMKAYLDSLPPSDNQVAPHDLKFPYSIRRAVGAWKLLYLDDEPVIQEGIDDEQLERGRYLAEGAGHCGECHTPRNFAYAMEAGRWMGGAENPEGEGRIPNITPGRSSFEDWSADDIEYYLESGVDPDFDVVGGTMVAVQENMSRLEPEDRAAIAAYLKALPAVSND